MQGGFGQAPTINEVTVPASNPVAPQPPALASGPTPGPEVRPGAGTPGNRPATKQGGPTGGEATFTASVPDVRHVSADPGIILAGIIATGVLLLLVPFLQR